MLRTIRRTPKRTILTVALAATAWGGFAVPAQADAGTSTAHYAGLDGNWFNAANWSTGRVPGPDTDVVLDGIDDVTIRPQLGTGEVQIRDLVVRDLARLSTLAGMVFRSRDERVADFGAVIHRSTESTGERLSAESCMSCTMVLNPSPKQKRILVLQSSVVPQSVGGGLSVQFGLGGRQAASPGHVGPGHYATLTAETAVLGGRLALATHYGFSPAAGDRYAIVTGAEVRGRFANAAEGDLVARFGDVGLFISYRGGDGNDVVLTAVALR